MDFRSKYNTYSYTAQEANKAWKDKIKILLISLFYSVCHRYRMRGGIYSKTLSDIGIAFIIESHYSKPILAVAKKQCSSYSIFSFMLDHNK
ncbi:hypothetical protein [Oceanobacillus timonensis]|uniref:hypothetical protein n=1 Tax=Oceanobacillus timonensis TaxID=1926285 RepID=UPI0009BA5EA3|nr:hypothetical protein [Oceanobacillus timonensis]